MFVCFIFGQDQNLNTYLCVRFRINGIPRMIRGTTTNKHDQYKGFRMQIYNGLRRVS